MVLIAISPGKSIRVRSPALIVIVEALRRAADTDKKKKVVRDVFSPFYDGGVDRAMMDDLDPSDFAELRSSFAQQYKVWDSGKMAPGLSDDGSAYVLDRLRAIIEAMDRDPRRADDRKEAEQGG